MCFPHASRHDSTVARGIRSTIDTISGLSAAGRPLATTETFVTSLSSIAGIEVSTGQRLEEAADMRAEIRELYLRDAGALLARRRGEATEDTPRRADTALSRSKAGA